MCSKVNVVSDMVCNDVASGVTRIFFFGGGGVQQIQLRTEDKENGDLETVAP